MANELVLPVTPSSLPQGFCPSDYQSLLNEFSSHQSVIFPDTFEGVIVSSTTPSDTSKVWIQLDSLGRPTRFYVFATGAWLALHPQVPGATMIWTTTLPDMNIFDGGDANPPSAISGPMWEVVSTIAARFPIGVGSLPSGAAIAVGDTGGEEKVTLDATNMPSHNHQLYVGSSDGSTGGIRAALQTVDTPHSGTDAAYQTSDGSGGSNYVKNSQGDGTGLAVAHNNIPPYLGVYFFRRTSRLFYAV